MTLAKFQKEVELLAESIKEDSTNISKLVEAFSAGTKRPENEETRSEK